MSKFHWRRSHSRWFTLYNGTEIMGSVAGHARIEDDWRMVRKGKFGPKRRTITEAAKDLLDIARVESNINR